MSLGLSRIVITLGLVSLFNDMASEMIYPLLPLFLTTVLGAGAAALGLVEGVAEATAAGLKLLSGKLSDRALRRKPFLLAGYGLSGALRPLMALAWAWPVVGAIRFADRIGKGLRSAPRDALIAEATPPQRLGAAFGFHRAMDHAGAVVGPLLAAALMKGFGFSLKEVFLCAFVPALVVMGLIVSGIKEPPAPPQKNEAENKPAGAVVFDPRLKGTLAALWLFTLGNATDAFLLLRLSQAGAGAALIAVLWSAHHVVKMVANVVGGRFSDRFGPLAAIVAGWVLYAAIYFLFALKAGLGWTVGVFLAYGLFYGLCEPSEKSLIARLAPAGVKGTTFGWYHATLGLGALPASLLFGVLWQRFGAPVAFYTGAGFALLGTVVLLWVWRGGGSGSSVLIPIFNRNSINPER